MSTRRPFADVNSGGFAAMLACSVLIAACTAPSNQTTPPASAPTPTLMSAASSGPLMVPELSGSVPDVRPVSPTETPTPSPEPAPAPVITAEPAQSSEPTEQPAPAPEPAARPAHAPGTIGGGKVVVIDPGHNGANAANPGVINALVPAGFGQTKPCNTTGTSTNAGYDEHVFTWNVANYLAPMLEAQGITVIMTRDSDDGVGPCVNRRAAIGNDASADVVISIHGDGDDASARGFYVMTAEQDPAGAEMAAHSHSFAVNVRDGLRTAGLTPSNHLGSAGLWPRNDLAGLNLSDRPTVMIEAGNMRNSADAALMSDSSGQQQIAQGLADGVLSYLAAG